MATPSAPPTLLASRYRLERRLAQGGMAEVWLATDEALSRPVAVKILKPQLARDAVATERFRREAVAVAGLMHPNIVTVYDTVEFDGQQAVVMQYIPGRSLREVLDEERKLGVEQTVAIGAAVAGALDAAHAAGLVHRDVKPGNILMTPDGRVLLTDFGIAKDTSAPGDDLTSDNVMMGTAKYLSPEQVRGKRLDGRADLYSLGLVLYECLAGRVPFQGDSDADTALARLQRDPTPLGRLRPTLPNGLVTLVHRLLARDPAERPRSGAEVQAALARVRLAPAPPPTPAAPVVDPLHAPAPARPFDAEAEDPDLARRPRGVPAEPPTAAAPGGGHAPPGTTPGSRATTPPSGRPRAPRADTPPAGVVVRGRPNKRLQQRRVPSLVVVGGLLLAALVAGSVLWVAVNQDDAPTSTVASKPSQIAVEPTAPAGSATPSGPLRVQSLATFDPRGDNEENDDQLDRARDENPETAWRTECYQNQYFGAKQGVGVVAELNGDARGVLSVTMAAAPWNLDVYVADSVADDLESWGEPVAQAAEQSELAVEFNLDESGRYVLLMLREAARDEQCSGENPFRGGIAEVGAG